MENHNKRVIIIIIIGALLVGNVFFGINYFTQAKELQEIKSTQTKTQLNSKVLDFASLFIKKVLQADNEVDFETRLSLENAVRDLEDDQIMAEWQNFVSSKTEAEAQASVKTLLGLLISKIQK
jgi:hypothetical protein